MGLNSNFGASRCWIRTDGDQHIGLGHLMRCQALMQHLPHAVFLIGQHSQPYIPNGIPYHVVPSGFSTQSAQALTEWVRPGDVLVLDSYATNDAYVHALRDMGCITIQINDIPGEALAVDLVINHCPGITEADFSPCSHRSYWLGLAYRLLRKEFQQLPPPQPKPSPPHLLICFGGTDGGSVLQKCLEATTQLNPNWTVTAVVGDLELASRIAPSRVVLRSRLQAPEMRELMLDSSLAWVPSSTLALECLMSGLPIVTGRTAPNQSYMYNGLASFSSVRRIGDWNAVFPADLISTTTDLLSQSLEFPELPELAPIADQLAVLCGKKTFKA